MAISPNSGAEISLADAQKLIQNFQAKFPGEIKASFVGIDTLNLVLNQEGVMGVRIYYGYDTDAKQISPVLVGVDEEGRDMTAVILDHFDPCPTECDSSSPLNN
ncbi:hypothetical protein [Flavobacterium okayamense]|uniref:Uncharacterized protein n=1 Tax=Flavobacterium okayamense TaxID=2830782 RepID=A0ABM7S463_9FLAO|nr:hypothetical protein [Flavobacterium okayamense]BCY28299.1 hypothetical protein KK2020170_11670 [Flavobacterium okayamense]